MRLPLQLQPLDNGWQTVCAVRSRTDVSEVTRCDCGVCRVDRAMTRLGIGTAVFALGYFSLHLWLVP